MRRAPLLACLVTLLACSTLIPTEVLVHVDADTLSRQRARQLHVLILDQEGVTRLDRMASLVGTPPEVELPTTVPVVPLDGDSTRTFTILAELIDQASVAFNKKAATLSFVAQTLVDVDLYFSDLCIGIECPTGQTCTNGVCVAFKMPPGTSVGCFNDLSLTPQEQQLIGLPADTWLDVPNTHFLDFCTPNEPSGAHAVSGCLSIIKAWGGGAWDPVHAQMILWGGGGNDYWGNEVYGFSTKTFTWGLLVPGSPIGSVAPVTDPLADGTPSSRATYDGLAYLQAENRLFAFGGSELPSASSAPLTWELDVENQSWQQVDPGHTLPADTDGYFFMGTAYDGVGHRVLMRNETGVSSYDLTANTWTRITSAGEPPLYPTWSETNYRRGVLDTKRRIFFTMGGKTSDGKPDFFAWDAVADQPVYDAWVTTGGDDIAGGVAPGADYDAAGDALVAWSGGAARVLDPTTKQWSTMSAVGAPPAAVTNGTFGRFRYIPQYNVFVLVNRWDEDVHFYKRTAGCGP